MNKKKFPSIKLFMGTGNLTELLIVTSGVNATNGTASELSISAVLVSSMDIVEIRLKKLYGKKIMYYSKINKRLPFRISERLMTTSNRKPVRKKT